jgi:hypothetical protein
MSEQNKAVPCVAESVEADFERGTWTFEPVGNFVVGAGRYVIVPEAEYVVRELNDELLELVQQLVLGMPIGDMNRDMDSLWDMANCLEDRNNGQSTGISMRLKALHRAGRQILEKYDGIAK